MLRFFSVAIRGSLCVAVGSLLLAACTVTGSPNGSSSAPAPAPAPSPVGSTNLSPGPTMTAMPPSGPPPAGYYRVQLSDTLYRIATDNGQNYRDIATWNNLPDPNQIKVGQLLRVVPPDGTGMNVAGTTPAANDGVVVGGAITTPPVYSANSHGELRSGTRQPAAGADHLALAWPVRGPVLQKFNASKNKGIDIGGTMGQPVSAAAGGKVVYAGNSLRGYGNLVIIKHNATFLTAYAHNRVLMVKEGETVTKGQKIAEMGNSDASRVELHFEVRRRGTPVDPLIYLPPS